MPPRSAAFRPLLFVLFCIASSSLSGGANRHSAQPLKEHCRLRGLDSRYRWFPDFAVLTAERAGSKRPKAVAAEGIPA
jgi:hypothetical protein